MRLSATLSPCRTWRYKLERIWQPAKTPHVWVMLNPSRADEGRDDPTIRRCIGFSLQWEAGGIEVYNLFAFRSTNPINLQSATIADRIGPENDAYLKAIPTNRLIIAAWGCFPEKLGQRDKEVLKIFSGMNVKCLGLTFKGYPKHPLFVSYATQLESIW